MTAILRVRPASFILAATLAPLAAPAADVCGARVSVRQIAMTPNEDGTRSVRYRASVATDQPSCARVTFTIVRSYIKPDGTTFEDMIPVDVEVPAGVVDVEGDTVANTRRLIYWRAEKITCQPCAKPSGAGPSTPARSSAPAPARGEGGSRLGAKTAIVGGAAVAIAAGAALTLGGGSDTDPGAAPGTSNPNPRSTPRPTATAGPTAVPTATPAPTPVIFPGAPPAATGNTESGDINLVNSDPPAGTSINSQQSTIGLRLNVYIASTGTDMRLDVQMWSGGQLCVRDISGPLDIKPGTPLAVQFPIPNTRRCTAPFRTNLLRVYLNDRGVPKLVQDFPVGYDFVP